MKQYVLGIDLGTSGVKAGLFNLSTKQLEYLTVRSYTDEAVQDPELLWGKTLDAIVELVGLSGGQDAIIAVGLSGQMHGAVLFDRGEKLISPIINWKDMKWSDAAILNKMKHMMGDQSYDELGTEISSGYSVAILFGIKEKDPALFTRIAHFVLPLDFLRGRLLGKSSFATDPTNAFGTGLFNTKLNCWHRDLIQKFSLPFNIFPELHPTHQKAGIISEQVADLTGLSGDIPVIYGGGDNQMSMLGCGLVEPGSPILINIGTAAQISKVIPKFRKYPGMDTRSYFQDTFAVVGASLAGGGIYESLRRKIQAEGVDLDYSQMDDLASTVSPGADGLLYCSGPSRQDPNRRQGFYGNIDKASSVPHRVRAVLEGVMMDLYAYYEILCDGQQSNVLIGAGKGLQKSRIWSQIAADIFGKPIQITGFENAVYGAALMAGFSLDRYKTLEESVQSIEYITEVVPDQTRVTFYQKEFINYWLAAIGAAGEH